MIGFPTMYLPRKENEDERTRVNEPSHTEEIRGKERKTTRNKPLSISEVCLWQ